MSAIHLVIYGRVQGVGYRSWTKNTATRLGLTGWVRNTRVGTVEAIFDGTAEALEEIRSLCKRGPLAAKVEHVEESPWTGEIPDDFLQRSTA